MNTLLHLPTQGQFVSAVQLVSGVLTIRLKPESVIEPDACAYLLSAYEPINGPGALRALELIRDAGEYQYISAQEDAVVLSGEGGEEIILNAERFSGERAELNASEFREALAFAVRLYENAHTSCRQAESRIHRVRDLLDEQARRISVKAAGHEARSTVGVLYAQQAQFIERVRRETEV